MIASPGEMRAEPTPPPRIGRLAASGALGLEMRARHEVHGPMRGIAEWLGRRVPAAAELDAMAGFDATLVAVGVDDDRRTVDDVGAVRLHLDPGLDRGLDRWVDPWLGGPFVHQATRMPAWYTAHTRQRARASDSGSPWTSTRSAGMPCAIRPACPSPRSSPPARVAATRASRGVSPAATSSSASQARCPARTEPPPKSEPVAIRTPARFAAATDA